MNVFKPITLQYWQVALFKLATISFGIFVGAYWSDFFTEWSMLFLGIFLVTTAYLFPLWWKNWRSE